MGVKFFGELLTAGQIGDNIGFVLLIVIVSSLFVTGLVIHMTRTMMLYQQMEVIPIF